ncbi:MAG: deoxyribose-phosphate aldolase [Porticoccaceae bacterium]|jgi:deoxyribose-phosphate aldolase
MRCRRYAAEVRNFKLRCQYSERDNMSVSYTDYSKMIDHSLLPPMLTEAELEAGCQLAVAYDVASVCILPYFMKRCTELLSSSTVKPSTTIGFPHGVIPTEFKVAESKRAIADGCEELDMVVNISQVKTGNWSYVSDDIKAVVDVAHAAGQKVKVIFENCYLADDEKIQLCRICTDVGADWVKTSTGFGTGGATMEDLKLMVENTPDHVQVKAAGGVRDFEKLKEVRALGVTRCGASATKAMLDGCRKQLGLPPIEVSDTAPSSGY